MTEIKELKTIQTKVKVLQLRCKQNGCHDSEDGLSRGMNQ